MGDRTIDVRNKIRPKTGGPRTCVAMTQQQRADGHHESESVPQKFVQLVGCRDPDARRMRLARTAPITSKS
jgi:hypothetical protein